MEKRIKALERKNREQEHEIERLITICNKLKSELIELKEIGDYQADRIKELTEENMKLENNIKEAYESERTKLGKSVLKQLLDKIE